MESDRRQPDQGGPNQPDDRTGDADAGACDGEAKGLKPRTTASTKLFGFGLEVDIDLSTPTAFSFAQSSSFGAMPQRTNFRNRPPQEVRVVVFGATGYIGRFVVKELVERGYQVIALRERTAAWAESRAANRSLQIFPEQRFGLGMSPIRHRSPKRSLPNQRMWLCRVLPHGRGRKDSWAIDYQATLNTYQEGKRAGASHYVLLSAICVQKPLLEFQKANWPLKQS